MSNPKRYDDRRRVASTPIRGLRLAPPQRRRDLSPRMVHADRRPDAVRVDRHIAGRDGPGDRAGSTGQLLMFGT